MKALNVVFVLCAAIVSSEAVALIFGEINAAMLVSTVNLKITHQHWLRSINDWEQYESDCSAVIVGTKPLTLLTAAHCFREAKTDAVTQVPNVVIHNSEASGIRDARLVKAFIRPFEDVEKDVGLDLAVLVFDARLDDTVKSLPIQKNMKKTKAVFICGFGLGYNEEISDDPRCSHKKVLYSPKSFYDIVPKSYEIEDAMLHIKARAQFEHRQEIVKTSNVLLTTNRLDADGRYSVYEPMPTQGDSGGPWLVKSAAGEFKVIAITSYVERFYNKSKFWDFFNRDVPLSDYPYVAYGIRLDNLAVKQFLKSAISGGAHIRFE